MKKILSILVLFLLIFSSIKSQSFFKKSWVDKYYHLPDIASNISRDTLKIWNKRKTNVYEKVTYQLPEYVFVDDSIKEVFRNKSADLFPAAVDIDIKKMIVTNTDSCVYLGFFDHEIPAYEGEKSLGYFYLDGVYIFIYFDVPDFLVRTKRKKQFSYEHVNSCVYPATYDYDHCWWLVYKNQSLTWVEAPEGHWPYDYLERRDSLRAKIEAAQLPISLFGQQIWVTVDPKGQDYQSAVLSKVILDSFEEDSISSWLNKKINFSILVEMDTLGYVHQVLKVNCRKAHYLKNCKERLEKALIEKHIRIPFWYEPIPVADPVAVIIQSIREDAQSSTDSSYYETATIGWPFWSMITSNLWSIDTLKELTEKNLLLLDNNIRKIDTAETKYSIVPSK